MKLKKENSKLKEQLSHAKYLENELKKANDQILLLNKEKYELMVKQNEEIKNYKLEMEKLLIEKDFHELNYNKGLSIFEQRMGKVTELEMENKVYKEELNDLKDLNKKLEESTKNKIKDLEVKNQLKFKSIKEKIMNDLTEAKDDMLKLNLNYNNINSQLIYLQNKKLLEKINIQNKGTKKLVDENNKLKIKIIDLENQKEIGDKMQLELTQKLNIQKNGKGNNYMNLNLFNKKNRNKNKKSFNFRKNFLINNSIEKFLDSNIFNTNDKETNKVSINNSNKKKKEKPLNSYITIPKKNKFFLKTENNSLNIKSDYLIEDSSDIKYEQMINKKNIEIENLNLKIESLNNRISFFANKYKKLYAFLEESLNTFFWEMKEESNFNLNFEDLNKFDFSKLDNKEKYAVLVLLMNRLLPLITFNFNSNYNLGNNIFSTNINIFDRSFNKTYKHLNDNILKKSFFGKNNKLQTDLFIKKEALNNGSIPVLRKSEDNLIVNNKLKEDKYKFIL